MRYFNNRLFLAGIFLAASVFGRRNAILKIALLYAIRRIALEIDLGRDLLSQTITSTSGGKKEPKEIL